MSFRTTVLLQTILLIPVATVQAADALPSPPARITDRVELDKIHYAKQGMALLPDTLVRLPDGATAFVATRRVTVPAGSSVSFQPGAVVFFEPSASFNVEGVLAARGDPLDPVSFKPIPTTNMYIAPKTNDTLWDGIAVARNGRLILDHVHISGAGRGIHSPAPCDSLTITNLTVDPAAVLVIAAGSDILTVESGPPFSLPCVKTARAVHTLPRRGSGIRTRNIAAALLWSGAGALALTGAWQHYAAYELDRQAVASGSRDVGQPLRDKATAAYRRATVFYSCAGGSFVGGWGVYLVFPIKKGK